MDKIRTRVKGGWLVATVSPDPNYPGIDVEFVSDNDRGEFPSRPRVLVERPEVEGEEPGPLRALIWGNRNCEDYTDEIEFE